MNVFPISVLDPANPAVIRHRDCRLTWDGTTSRVWTWPSNAPKAYALITVEGTPENDGNLYRLETPDGPILLREEQTCGCGSKLKGYTPTAAKPTRAFTESP